MKRLLLLWVMLALLLLAALAPSVLAQEVTGEEPQKALAAEPGAPPPPEYAVSPDGRYLIVGGDVVIDCEPTPPLVVSPGYGELCASRDSLPPGQSLPPGGPTVVKTAPPGDPQAEAEAKAQAEEKAASIEAGIGKKDELPGTGGVSLIGIGACVLIAGGVLVVRKVVR